MMGLGGDEDKMENGGGGGGFFESFKVKGQVYLGSEGLGPGCGGFRGGVIDKNGGVARGGLTLGVELDGGVARGGFRL